MIDLDSANLSLTESASILNCLVNGVVSTRGDLTVGFEHLIARYLGENYHHILAVNSGTSALYLALKCSDLNPNSLVAVPALKIGRASCRERV